MKATKGQCLICFMQVGYQLEPRETVKYVRFPRVTRRIDYQSSLLVYCCVKEPGDCWQRHPRPAAAAAARAQHTATFPFWQTKKKSQSVARDVSFSHPAPSILSLSLSLSLCRSLSLFVFEKKFRPSRRLIIFFLYETGRKLISFLSLKALLHFPHQFWLELDWK